MENKNLESMQDEVYTLEEQMDTIVDTMIEKFGKFITLRDVRDDSYKASLVSNYNTLLRRKEVLINQINDF